jgi:hypothetical protein
MPSGSPTTCCTARPAIHRQASGSAGRSCRRWLRRPCASRLGTSTLCSSFRNPAVLAKMAVSLDEVSGGRLIFGIGAGWDQPEYRAFGLPLDRRVDRFEEAVQIITALLREGRVDFAGQLGCFLRGRSGSAQLRELRHILRTNRMCVTSTPKHGEAAPEPGQCRRHSDRERATPRSSRSSPCSAMRMHSSSTNKLAPHDRAAWRGVPGLRCASGVPPS